MASLLDLYKTREKEIKVDTIATDKASSLAKATPYSLDDSKNADLKVLTADRLKFGYALGELGGGSTFAPGYSDAKGKTYSEQVKK
jgi:hypothetical protein